MTPLEVLSPIRLCGASNDDDGDVDRQGKVPWFMRQTLWFDEFTTNR